MGTGTLCTLALVSVFHYKNFNKTHVESTLMYENQLECRLHYVPM